jgi:8-oxo-dGTP diphosphatase
LGEAEVSRTEQVELTTLCMVYRGEELLLQNRVKTDWRGYCFPGGHVEPGESILDSVVREMKEETGLTILSPRLCGIKQFPIDGGRYLVFFFKTDSFEGELISSNEGNVEWIARRDLLSLNTVSDFMDMLKVFDRDDLTAFQYVVQNDKWNVILK